MRKRFFEPDVSATAPKNGERMAEMAMLKDTTNVKSEAP
jgi:hypothetical protein